MQFIPTGFEQFVKHGGNYRLNAIICIYRVRFYLSNALKSNYLPGSHFESEIFQRRRYQRATINAPTDRTCQKIEKKTDIYKIVYIDGVRRSLFF